MSCPHGNPIGGCDTCDEVDAAFEAGKRSAMAEQPAQQEPGRNHWEDGDVFERIGAMKKQPAQQEPVAWALYQKGRLLSFWMDKGDAYDFEFTSEHSWVPLYTSPPAQRKPLTDDPLQGAVDWLLEADGEYFCTATVQRTLRIGYNRAKRLCDTAKERAAHGIKEQP